MHQFATLPITRLAATAAALVLSAGSGTALAQGAPGDDVRPITAKLGSFLVGGTVIDSAGTFDPSVFPPSPEGQRAYVDHAYVQYLIPPEARELPLVMWHGGGQYGKTWESTPDGREGFQTIFVRRGFATYVVDQPRRGRAGNTAEGTTIGPGFNDAFLWNTFRLGIWDESGRRFFPKVSFPQDSASLDQYFRQTTPNTGPNDNEVITDALAALFDTIGPAVLITHSASGILGWLTAMKSENLKAIVSYEPTVFSFAEGELPPPIPSPLPSFEAFLPNLTVPPAEFEKLTRIPIQIVYGDNIAESPSTNWGVELWRVGTARAEQFRDAVNRHGGDASVLYLPDAGLHGNTHFPFSDLNNVEVANLLQHYLRQKGLDR